MDWIRTAERKPPELQVVQTKIDDGKFVRNEQPLIFWKNCWFLCDLSMYVYYKPTHWRTL